MGKVRLHAEAPDDSAELQRADCLARNTETGNLPTPKKIRFSLKTMLGLMTIVAVLVFSLTRGHEAYCSYLALKYVREGRVVEFTELYSYGQKQSFGPGWLDDATEYVAAEGELELLKFLTGITGVNGRIENEWTYLMHAAQRGNIDTVIWLLKCGANPKLQDSVGKTASQIATKEGHTQIEQLLVAASSESWADDVRRHGGYRSISEIRQIDWTSDIEQQLKAKDFRWLNQCRMHVGVKRDELACFRLTGRVAVAVRKGGTFVWIIDGKRLEFGSAN